MSKRYNFLIILSDQQRYDCIGYSGRYPVHTPNIDKLASEGIWFSHAFTPIPVCCPSRQSMLAGRRAETIGALWNFNNALRTGGLQPEDYNWVADLADHGYHTSHIGKWSIHPDHTPECFGFKDFVSEKEYHTFRQNKYPDIRFENGFLGEKDPVPLEDARTHWMADQAIHMIDQYSRQDSPWLVWLDFSEPHLPCRPSKPFSQMVKPEEVPVWDNFKEDFKGKPYIQRQQLCSWGIEHFTWQDWAPVVARYYGVISQVDDAIGKVLRAAEAKGLMENTVIIYTADHGDMCGGHRMLDKHYVLYDDIVRVPLIIRCPGVQSMNRDCDQFICHSLDLPPTLLEIAGIKPKEFFQGKSLLPFLLGQTVENWRQEVVSTYNGQQFGLYTQRMIRNRRWKYIWNTTDTDELYDLEKDPGELNNLIGDVQYAGLLTDLRKKLFQELEKDEDGLVKNNPWMKNQLYYGKKL